MTTAEMPTRVQIDPFDCLSRSKELLQGCYWLFFGITFVGMILVNVVPLGILAGPMMCGMYLCWFTRMRGEPVNFEMLFKGFDYFVESLVATLIIIGVMMVVMVPCYFLLMAGIFTGAAASEQGSDAAGAIVVLVVMLFTVVIIAFSLAIGILTLFVYHLIVDRGLKAVPALKTSMAAARVNLGGLLGLMLVVAGVLVVASLLCYIPVFFAAPWCMGAITVAYRKIFPELPADHQA